MVRRSLSRQSDTFARRKRQKTILLWSVSVMVLFGGLWGLSYVSRLPFFNIKVVEVIGADVDIAASLRAASSEVLEGDYVYLFPKSNVFLYPRGQVARVVEEASPRVKSVEVKRNSWNSLLVTVKEKEPAALVCATFPDFDEGALSFNENGECLFADDRGLLYEEAPSIAGTLYDRYYIPKIADLGTSTHARIGLYATSTKEFIALEEFYAGLRKNKLEVQAILIKEGGEYEAYIQDPERKATVVVYFNNARSLSVQLTNLVLFWSHALEEGRLAKKLPRYESIDVRYGANVFFRESKDTL